MPTLSLAPPADVLVGNFAAVALVWLWAALAGAPMGRLLRVPLGWAAVPTCGLAYWAATPYLLPFAGGQSVALGLAAVAGGVALLGSASWPAARRFARSPANWLLVAFGLSLHSATPFNAVPVGMDASMHATAARLLAGTDGLPRTHAPFAPELPFPAVNLGLPSLAAVAVRCGATPEAATLATVPFALTNVTLAVLLLVRPWVPRFGAVCLGVLAVAGSRGLQETVGWGGFPTAAGVAVGVLAGRTLFDLLRRPAAGTAVVAGVLVAAIPLVHGIAGAVWVYVAGPVLGLVAVRRVTRWRAVLPVGATAVGVAAAVFAAYLLTGHAPVSDEAREWTRRHQGGFAPAGEGLALVRNSADEAARTAGHEVAVAWAIAVAWLLVRGRWAALATSLLGALAVVAVVLNSRFWVLPGSVALYPERAPYYLNPLCSLALAQAWRALPHWSRRLRGWWALAAVALVAGTLPFHLVRYHRTVTQAAVPAAERSVPSFPVVGRDEYAVLRWCGERLDPSTDLVDVGYNTAGSYLPSVAGIACTGWHVHCFVLPEFAELLRRRPPTHRIDWNAAGDQPGQVFRSGRAAVLRIAR